MRLGWTKTKYSVSYYVQKTIYVNGKNKSLVVKRLGSEKQICEKYGVTDAKAWAKEQIRLMNEAEKEDSAKFNIELCAGTDLVMNEQRRFNGGYLFLQDIYYELGLHKICRAISGIHHFEYDLNNILSRLIYTIILYPASKKSSFDESKRFIEQPSLELHDIYRALSVINPITAANKFVINNVFHPRSRKQPLCKELQQPRYRILHSIFRVSGRIMETGNIIFAAKPHILPMILTYPPNLGQNKRPLTMKSTTIEIFDL